ncbi:MAG TPA: DUF3179 domain-containing (seleno)protein, partial [Bacteroidales bacterium]|nr:DUF3179 domain-containing (seleno)protein [Bacteroidales bacterium]
MKYTALALLILTMIACEKEERINTSSIGSYNNHWAIPQEEILNDTSNMDNIASIDTPKFLTIEEHGSLPENIRVLVYKNGEEVKIYPYGPMTAHEIVNDNTNGLAHAVTFCPITSSGLNWGRKLNGEVTEFGVSGMLYKSNLMPYDRNTRSIWSQMLMIGVNGRHINDTPEILPLLETSWGTATHLFPGARVLKPGDTTECEECQPNKSSKEISPAETMYGVLSIKPNSMEGKKEAFLFRYESFGDSITVFKKQFLGSNHLLIGSKEWKILTAFTLPESFITNTFSGIIQP